MKIAKQTPTYLKLVHRPWMIWILALFFWMSDCYCIISPPPGSRLVIALLTVFPLALLSIYPLVVCNLSKDSETLILRRCGFWGQRIAEYPFQIISAIEVVEGINSHDNRFYKIRLIAKSKPLYLSTSPIEDVDRAHFIAQSVSNFLTIPLNFIPARSCLSAPPKIW
jgi:hypothetical protein